MDKINGLTIFGEVLFDCFPDGNKVLGGAPFNVAWHCQAFGLSPLLVSRVGDDKQGHEILSAMTSWGMDTTGIQTDNEHKTGQVSVSFNHGEPEYDIVEHSSWDYIKNINFPYKEKHSVLYHGSLVTRNSVSENSLEEIKQEYAGSVFIDVNLRPPWWKIENIQKMMETARWVKLNIDELKLLVPETPGTIEMARYLIQHYSPELVVVTQGEKGAIAVTANEEFSIKPTSAKTVVDTVGAGDAFASVLLLGLYKDWPVETILARAQNFASNVVGLRGATTTDMAFYQPLLNEWKL